MNRVQDIRWVRSLWLAAALIALGLATLGIVLPGLPTTPFVLVAAYAAARGSPRLSSWLHAHRVFGPVIREWERHRAVTRRAKRIAVLAMAGCVVAMALTAPAWWMTALVAATLTAVGTWLWRRPEPPASNADARTDQLLI